MATKNNFPEFLFTAEEIAKINKKHFTEEQQELFGLLHLYGTLEKLPYAYVQSKGVYKVLSLVKEITAIEGGMSAINILEQILAAPNQLFDVRNLPKQDLVKCIDYVIARKTAEPQQFSFQKMYEQLLTLKQFADEGVQFREPNAFMVPEDKWDKWFFESYREKYNKYNVFKKTTYFAVPDDFYTVEITESTDPEYLAAKEKFTMETKAYRSAPVLFEYTPGEFKKKTFSTIKLTEKALKFLDWYKELATEE